jgi:NADH dehydrogenase
VSTTDGSSCHRVVVVGGGFGGLQAVRRLRSAPVDVTLIDRRSEPGPQRRAAWLTFVVVGAGATGVELAGQIGELARETLRGEFRNADTRSARILLVERATVMWAAGVAGAELAETLAKAAAVAPARGRRVAVGPDLTVGGHPEILAIGDMAQVHDAARNPVSLPGLAPVAMQQGRYAARAILERLRGAAAPRPFRYRDKGDLATIGRAKAVGVIAGLRLSGLAAWLTWLLVHLFYLIGLQNRLVVLVRWTFSYITRTAGVRLVVPEPTSPTERSTPWPYPSDAATSRPSTRSDGIPSASSSSSTSRWGN